MCGILGAVGFSNSQKNWVQDGIDDLRHRGPDDNGLVEKYNMCFGMTRLSIIDISGGKQPFQSVDKRYTIVFNGQIYNFRKLREELITLGLKFYTLSDTEVVLNTFKHFGYETPNKLEGMFAFAIWDELNKVLFAARDRFGEKPFVYNHFNSGEFIFASEVKAILTHPQFSKNPDIDSIFLMLNYGYVPNPRSAFQGIKKLNPGHYLVCMQNKVEIFKYWNPILVSNQELSEKKLVLKLDELLEGAVQQRMISDRGFGAWLSGGVDSSLITYYMAKNQDTPIHTFSANFSVKDYDESMHSLEVSKYLKTDHHPLMIDSGIEKAMLEISNHLDEPFSDSSFVATYLLSKHTGQSCVVVLGGDGGDEVFGGYERYRIIKILNDNKSKYIISSVLQFLSLFKVLVNVSPRMMRILNSQSFTSEIKSYQNFMTWVSQEEIGHILKDSNSKGIHNWFENEYKKIKIPDQKIDFSVNHLDIMTYLPGDLLPKVDMASMAFGVEVRSPFLDTGVFDFGINLANMYRVKYNESKYLLKVLARSKLPESIVNRPKKGFGIPRDEWLRGQLNSHLCSVLSKNNKNFKEIVNISVVEEKLRDFNSGKKSEIEIWSLYMLANWAKVWL